MPKGYAVKSCLKENPKSAALEKLLTEHLQKYGGNMGAEDGKFLELKSVKTVHACPPNFEVSSPTFECRMWRSGNRSQRFAPNVPTFRQNVRANLSNFIQDLFWRVRFSNENFKMVELEVFKRRFQDGRRRPC